LARGEEGRGGVTLEKTSTRTIYICENRQKEDDGLKSAAIAEHFASTAPQRDQNDWRNQFPPDGKRHQTREWIEGDQRVVERTWVCPEMM
jgi:negative regulator of sigma E activity